MSESILNPQQELFLASYTNPNSATFGNAYQSALKAGYTEEYSQNMIGKDLKWLSVYVSDMGMLAKAEKVLNETLEMEHVVPAIGMFGPVLDQNKNPVMKVDKGILAIKHDSAKFVAETIGKRRFSKKSPLESSDGQPITVKIIQYPADGGNVS